MLIVALLWWLAPQAWADTLETVTEDSSYAFVRDGKVSGVSSQIVEAMLKQAGLTDYHMAIYPWARAYDRALREPNVVIYPIMRRPEREGLFNWIGQIDLITPVFYKLREHSEVQVKVLDDAQNYRVGVLRDDYREKYLQDQGFTRLVVAPSNLENFNRLLNGQVSLVAMPERDARKLCSDAGIPFTTLEQVYALNDLTNSIYVAMSKGTPDDIVERARAAFEQLKASGAIRKMLEQ
jgi:polar amino acid transport system substrate-binding protein